MSIKILSVTMIIQVDDVQTMSDAMDKIREELAQRSSQMYELLGLWTPVSGKREVGKMEVTLRAK